MISVDKQYRTKNGYEVRIYAVDGNGLYKVHGAVFIHGGWHPNSWPANGKHTVNPDFDLIEVKPRIQREYWANVYPMKYRPDITIHPSESEAEEKASDALIACVKITIDCEEGEGL